MPSTTRVWCFVVALAAGLLLAVAADAKPPKPRRPPGRGQPKAGKVQELYGIAWYRTLDSALAAAKADESGGQRPVFCLRVLGELDGLM